MKRLLTWLSKFNTSDYNPDEFIRILTPIEIITLSSWYANTLRDLYIEDSNPKNKTNYPIRSSMLGKPALLIAYNYYHPGNSNTMPNTNTRLAYFGHMFELWLAIQIMRLGYYVEHNVSKPLDIDGTEIDCHVDLLVTDLSTQDQIIIECKELSDWYFKQWYGETYSEPDDDRGYITQAALYSKAFNTPVLWVLGNRVDGRIGFDLLSEEDKNHHYNRVRSILRFIMRETSTWEECFKYMQPEPPNVTKKGLTVPFAMKPIADKVYQLNSSGYVLDYKYPIGYEEYKPELK